MYFQGFYLFCNSFSSIFLSRFSKKINPVRMKTMEINSNLFWILLNTFEFSGLEEMNEKTTPRRLWKKSMLNVLICIYLTPGTTIQRFELTEARKISLEYHYQKGAMKTNTPNPLFARITCMYKGKYPEKKPMLIKSPLFILMWIIDYIIKDNYCMHQNTNVPFEILSESLLQKQISFLWYPIASSRYNRRKITKLFFACRFLETAIDRG